jgi:hypothetical protein
MYDTEQEACDANAWALREIDAAHWIEYCPECRQTFVVGDGIPPAGTTMLDKNDPYA